MKKILILIIIIGLGWFAWYAISPLFNDVVVDDPLPTEVEDTLSEKEREVIESGGGFNNLSEEDQAAMMEMMKEADEAGPLVMNDSLTDLSIELANATEEDVDEPIIRPVMDTIGHPASGTVRVIDTAEGQIIRYEDFKTINGPRLNVYLAKDLDADEFIDLGPIRGTEGNINYTVPEGIDLDEYRYVMYWCVPFGVLFNYADLAS